MKKISFVLCTFAVMGLFAVLSGCSCSSEKEEKDSVSAVDSSRMPLNVSIYLDLSDRLVRDMTPSQKERDMEIVGYMCGIVKEHAVAQQIVPSKDRIKVFFYPSPDDPKISLLSEDLEMDLSKAQPAEKRKLLKSFEDKFQASLGQIYDSTLKDQNWIGSDIWGFFNKQVDTYCVREGARNVIVILTDGYIYYEPNKQNDGDSYSYILPQTLRNPNSRLIDGREGKDKLDNLEVLLLEVNPTKPTQQNQMENIIGDWLKGMGVKKYYVGETDQPSNTKLIIDKFMK